MKDQRTYRSQHQQSLLRHCVRCRLLLSVGSSSRPKNGNANHPYTIKHERHQMVEHPTEQLTSTLLRLVETFSKEGSRAELLEPWVPYYKLVSGVEAAAPLTKVAKLCLSLRRHLPHSDPERSDHFLEKISKLVEAKWSIVD